MGLLQLSLEKVPTQPRGTILVGSKLFDVARGREKEKKARERERDSATEDKGLIVRMDSDRRGFPKSRLRGGLGVGVI